MATLESLLSPEFLKHPYFHIALTHRSTGAPHNERLEFLGDSVLGVVISRALYLKFEEHDEGALTRMRSFLVRKEMLGELATEYQLQNLLKFGRGERKNEGAKNLAILGNALEAIVGALYLAEGFPAVEKFILSIYHQRLEQLSPENTFKDSKSLLQEYTQAQYKILPQYDLLSEDTRDDGKPYFKVRCIIPNFGVQASGESTSKGKAEQTAAGKILEMISPEKDDG